MNNYKKKYLKYKKKYLELKIQKGGLSRENTEKAKKILKKAIIDETTRKQVLSLIKNQDESKVIKYLKDNGLTEIEARLILNPKKVTYTEKANEYLRKIRKAGISEEYAQKLLADIGVIKLAELYEAEIKEEIAEQEVAEQEEAEQEVAEQEEAEQEEAEQEEELEAAPGETVYGHESKLQNKASVNEEQELRNENRMLRNENRILKKICDEQILDNTEYNNELQNTIKTFESSNKELQNTNTKLQNDIRYYKTLNQEKSQEVKVLKQEKESERKINEELKKAIQACEDKLKKAIQACEDKLKANHTAHNQCSNDLKFKEKKYDECTSSKTKLETDMKTEREKQEIQNAIKTNEEITKVYEEHIKYIRDLTQRMSIPHTEHKLKIEQELPVLQNGMSLADELSSVENKH